MDMLKIILSICKLIITDHLIIQANQTLHVLELNVIPIVNNVCMLMVMPLAIGVQTDID